MLTLRPSLEVQEVVPNVTKSYHWKRSVEVSSCFRRNVELLSNQQLNMSKDIKIKIVFWILPCKVRIAR